MCCVALCVRISHWIDYDIMFYSFKSIVLHVHVFFFFCLVCCIYCLFLSLPFWWINVFIILVGLYVLHVRLLTDWLFFCFIFLCTWFLCKLICVLSCVGYSCVSAYMANKRVHYQSSMIRSHSSWSISRALPVRCWDLGDDWWPSGDTRMILCIPTYGMFRYVSFNQVEIKLP